MKFKTENNFCNYINSLGGKAYLVGGAVRDNLMNQECNDRDYTIAGISPESLESSFKKIAGSKFPVFLVEIEHQICEVALVRKERKSGVGHKGFTFYTDKNVTIEEDLERRDFTINSMAIDLENNELIDPFNGKNDLENKILRATSSAFEEDYLRIFRAARFLAQLDFTCDSELINKITYMSDNKELFEISPERIFKEMEKALSYSNCSIFFEILLRCNVLQKIMPEVYALNVPDKHDGTAYNHTMKLLEFGVDPKERFALLCHDIGKGLTDSDMHPSHYHHDKLGLKAVEKLCNRLKAPNEYKDIALATTGLHIRMKSFFDMRIGKRFKFCMSKNFCIVSRLSMIDSAFRENGDQATEFKLHDDRIHQYYLSKEAFNSISGKDLIENGYSQGKKLGEVLFQERVRFFRKIQKTC